MMPKHIRTTKINAIKLDEKSINTNLAENGRQSLVPSACNGCQKCLIKDFFKKRFLPFIWLVIVILSVTRVLYFQSAWFWA